MTKKLLFIGSISLLAMACGGNVPTPNTNTANANVAVNSVANTTNVNIENNANTANTTNTANTANKPAAVNANKPTNTTAAKPAESGPKRISFAAGKSEGKESVSLKAGELKQFVVGAKSGQIFMVDTDSKNLEITMVKGKVATDATLIEPGHYDTTLLGDGDFVFQVKNTSKTEVKTSMSVVISNTGISNR